MTLAALVSPYVGVVRAVDELLVATCDAPLPRFGAEIADDERILGARLDLLGGLGGVAVRRDDAVAAALGEAAERYSLSYVPAERVVHASAAELGSAAADPAGFALFADSQYDRPGFPFVRFGDDTRVPWVDATRLDTGGDAWVPAELVFLADPVAAGDARIGYATTSGAACAASRARALLSALLELCERDAFLLAWADASSPPLLDWRRNAELAAFERRTFARTGLRYAAVDLSPCQGIPCVLGVVRAPAPGPALAVGAAAAPTIEQAWQKALSEAFTTNAMARRLLERRPLRTFDPGGDDVRTLEDHVLFHARHEHAHVGAFLDASSERRDVADVPPLPGAEDDERAAAVVARIAAAGSASFAVDVTAPDLRTLGLHCVKALAPGLCMLDAPHAGRFLGNARLGTGPNRYPHPFP